MSDDAIIEVEGLRTQFGQQVIHDNLDVTVRRGEVMGVVGGSGTGKSVLMRTIIGLTKPAAGRIRLFDCDTAGLSTRERRAIERRWGVLFQDGALFSSLTVAQNIQVPLKEHTKLSAPLQRELIDIKARNCPAACASAPAWPGPWRWIRRFCSWTSRPPAWTPSAPPSSTS
jgi:phospholipid/cholesterol/gamma-HCH transport system ATP-binding protein